jgi:hypothetical protein
METRIRGQIDDGIHVFEHFPGRTWLGYLAASPLPAAPAIEAAQLV